MRYGDGGGLDQAERDRRERVRERAAALFAEGVPAVEDQRWTLARIAALIVTMFHLQVGITTVWQAMRRLGYTAQLPAYRAIERDEQAIAHWRRYQWPGLKESQPAGARGSASPMSAARR
jgi:transposase